MKKLVDTLPMSTATRIPAPGVLPSTPETEGTAANRPLERRLAGLLASVMRQDEVAVDANFFEELGADSLVMAQFCARVRKQPDLPSVSMKDVYRHPTIKSLATSLGGTEPVTAGHPMVADLVASPAAGPGTSTDLVPTEHSGRAARGGRHRRTPAEGTPATTTEYVVCGALQTLIFLAYTFLGPYMPSVIQHKGASLNRLASHMWLTTEGVFGIALGVSEVASHQREGRAVGPFEVEADLSFGPGANDSISGGGVDEPAREAGGEHAEAMRSGPERGDGESIAIGGPGFLERLHLLAVGRQDDAIDALRVVILLGQIISLPDAFRAGRAAARVEALDGGGSGPRPACCVPLRGRVAACAVARPRECQ